jgi:hypothetical protein
MNLAIKETKKELNTTPLKSAGQAGHEETQKIFL